MSVDDEWIKVALSEWRYLYRSALFYGTLCRGLEAFRDLPTWYTAKALANAGLPGLEGGAEVIERTAEAEKWMARASRNGEPEYHFSTLPTEAFHAIIGIALGSDVETEPNGGGDNVVPAWKVHLARVVRSLVRGSSDDVDPGVVEETFWKSAPDNIQVPCPDELFREARSLLRWNAVGDR